MSYGRNPWGQEGPPPGPSGPPGSGQPWPPPPEYRAAINPPSLYNIAATQGQQYIQTQVYFPTPILPVGPNLAWPLRIRPIQDLVNPAINVAVNAPILVDIPDIAYAWTGSAVNSDGSALPNGMDPLTTFLVQRQRSTGDLLDTNPTLAACVLGTAREPALMGGLGWQLDRGTTVQVLITPLRANLRISVAMWCIEVAGPGNFTVPTGGGR